MKKLLILLILSLSINLFAQKIDTIKNKIYTLQVWRDSIGKFKDSSFFNRWYSFFNRWSIYGKDTFYQACCMKPSQEDSLQKVIERQYDSLHMAAFPFYQKYVSKYDTFISYDTTKEYIAESLGIRLWNNCFKKDTIKIVIFFINNRGRLKRELGYEIISEGFNINGLYDKKFNKCSDVIFWKKFNWK